MATNTKTKIKDTILSNSSYLIEFQNHKDDRGTLLPIEFENLPFTPKRLFTVTGESAGTVRGGHGHYTCQQFLICLSGRVDILLRNGNEEKTITLMPNKAGLLIDSGVWCKQTYVAENSILLVLASEPYNIDSYFEDCK